MGTIARRVTAVARVYDDPKDPAKSEYTEVAVKTIPEAVIDPNTGDDIIKIIDDKLAKVGGMTVDSELSSTSTNPVQNKVIKGSLDAFTSYADSRIQAIDRKADSTASELESVKKSVSEGKSAIASTLTENGVSTDQDATFETINENIRKLAQQKYDEGYADGIEYASLIPLDSKESGDIVKIKENGELVDFLIVHKGNPDTSLYDKSCDGVWVVRDICHSQKAFSASNSNDIENSDIQAWLNGEYLNNIDSKIREAIKNVKIPFKKGTGNASTGVQSGTNGLPCKVFLLSGYEVGFTQATDRYFPIDGAKLSYFIEGTGADANNKRIGKQANDSAVYWWLRSPYTSNAYYVWYVYQSGVNVNDSAHNTVRWARPAFVLPSNLLVNPENNEVVVPKDFAPPPGTLEETDWETISKIAETGQAPEYWNIGDTKNITLSTGEEITVRIEDFDHDDLTEGGKAPITFGMVDCLKDTSQMNSSDTNNGGWGSSAMRTSRMAALFSQLPSDLQKVIKSVTKTTSAGDKSSSLTTTDDKLWLFSYTEVNFDHDTNYSPGGEGTAYPLFTNDASRVKKRDKSASIWWIRSPVVINGEYFCYVKSNGDLYYISASADLGVAVGFCI